MDWDEIERDHEKVEKRLNEQERQTEELAERVRRLEEMAKLFELGVSHDSDNSS